MSSDCATCASGGTQRYCAPARCYCGHPVCYAFASYVDLATVPLADSATNTSTTWKEREESTWIDKL